MITTSALSKFDYEPLSLDGKAIVVTGGTTGIGRATALLLASHRARVLIFGRHEPELHDALQDIKSVGGEVYGMTADQARPEDIRRVFEEVDRKLGGLDILINNAGLAADSVEEGDFTQWRYVVETNLLGYMACAGEALTRMRERGGGHIVNIGSMSAEAREAGSDVYVATKAGIRGFSESLYLKVREEGIRVTLIEPGSVGTDLPESPKQRAPEYQKKQAKALRQMKAEDIAYSVYYCLTQPPRCDVTFIQVRPHLEED